MSEPVVRSTLGSSERNRAVKRVIWLTLWLNILVALVKLGIGFVTSNLTVMADAVHGFLDAANNVIGLCAISLATRPPDENHPYGHRKFEAIAALGIGAIMALTSWEIVKTVFGKRFFNETQSLIDAGEHPTVSLIAVVLTLLGLVFNIFISWYELRRGREYKSMFLIADSMHTRSDIFVTLASVSSLLVAPRLPMLDGVFSMVVIVFILHTGWRVIRENVLLLTDVVQIDAVPVKRIAESVEGVLNAHAIRSHGMPDAVHLDLHVVVHPDLNARQTHELEMKVRKSLMAAFPQVTEVSIHHQTHAPETLKPLSREYRDE